MSELAIEVRDSVEASFQGEGYTVEVDGQHFTQAQWEAVQRYCEGSHAALAVVERVRAIVDFWNDTPDYQPSEYDKGRVDQRHAMTEQLIVALEPEEKD